MREEYDFSTAKKNPYAKRLKKQITINIDAETVEYFKAMSSHSGIPYQTLIIFILQIVLLTNENLQYHGVKPSPASASAEVFYVHVTTFLFTPPMVMVSRPR